MYMIILGLILLILKIAAFGPIAHLPWYFVLAPFGLATAWWAWADMSGWTKRQEIIKMDDKKKQRRIDAMDKLGIDVKGRSGRSTSAKVARHRQTPDLAHDDGKH